jgi:hypothetical protein
MALHSSSQKFLDQFLAAIAPFEAAHQHVGFSYIAIKNGERFVLRQGRLFLTTYAPNARSNHFRSPHVRAGHYPLAELNTDLKGFIDALLTGKLDTPGGALHFPAGGGYHAASYVAFHPDGLQNQTRIGVLTLLGAQQEPIPQPDIDWEIKAATPPYDGVPELAREYGLDAVAGDAVSVGIVAFNIAAVDVASSKVKGTAANVQILLANNLPTDRAAVTYRTYVLGVVKERGTISGSTMDWTEGEGFQRGRFVLEVPAAAALNCTVSYDGIAQSHWWMFDPAKAQNARRAVYEVFDPKLQNLQAIVANAQARGQDARNLEAAVAWLFWMLGFSVAHLGAMPKSQDAPDLLMITPAGHFAVIECTTGLLKAENKLALLHARAQSVRHGLDASNNKFQRVLPVIVTSRTKDEIAPDIEAAEKLGIYIVTRESLEQVIPQTMYQPNPDQTYAIAEQIVSAAKAKHQTQENLQLGNAGTMPPSANGHATFDE